MGWARRLMVAALLLAAPTMQAAEERDSPHWRQDPQACRACHLSESDRTLREEDINRLCNRCHENDAIGSYIHAVGMAPPEPFLQRMPQDFRAAIERGDGKVTCIACHDLPMQCEAERQEERARNPRFFRGGPYGERTDLCFNCHNPQRYERYNPHDQITDEGELDTQSCFVCHSAVPKRAEAKSIDDVQFNVTEKLERLCTGCHPWRPHPGGSWAHFGPQSGGGGPNHLVVPPEAIARRLEKHQAEHDIVMPREPGTGRIFCATCHNPHERGVQYRQAADKGADGVRRLRRGRLQVCTACHDK